MAGHISLAIIFHQLRELNANLGLSTLIVSSIHISKIKNPTIVAHSHHRVHTYDGVEHFTRMNLKPHVPVTRLVPLLAQSSLLTTTQAEGAEQPVPWEPSHLEHTTGVALERARSLSEARLAGGSPSEPCEIVESLEDDFVILDAM